MHWTNVRQQVKKRQVNMEDEGNLGDGLGHAVQVPDDDEEVKIIKSTYSQEKTAFIIDFAYRGE